MMEVCIDYKIDCTNIYISVSAKCMLMYKRNMYRSKKCVWVCMTPADTLQTVGVKRRVRRLKKSKDFSTARKTNSTSIRHIKDPKFLQNTYALKFTSVNSQI